MELTTTQMFVIAMLLLAAFGAFKVVRYATLEEAENKRTQEKLVELQEKIAILQAPASSRELSGKNIEHTENALFMNVRAQQFILELLDYNERVTQELSDLRGLNKSYKSGDRNRDDAK